MDPMSSEREPSAAIDRGAECLQAGCADFQDIPEPMARMAGGFAHDFNNLLTVINGYGELLVAGMAHDASRLEYVREILKAGSKGAEIVEMLLAYSGRQPIGVSIFDANHALEGMRDFLGLYLGEAIDLGMELCGEPCPVRGDLSLLQSALINLVMNAKEAIPGNGSVRIGTRRLGDGESVHRNGTPTGPGMELSVADTGIGIPDALLGRIFEPYYSTKKTANIPGTGLGLSSVQGSVRQFGGEIRVESEDGSGTVFRIRLPVAGGD